MGAGNCRHIMCMEYFRKHWPLSNFESCRIDGKFPTRSEFRVIFMYSST